MTQFSFDPSAVSLSTTAVRSLTEIDRFRGSWTAWGRLEPDRLQLLRRVATIESVGSSTRIEGSALSDAEVERLLARLEIGSFTSRDEQEVAGYAQTMDTIFDSFSMIPPQERYLKQLHRDLLRYSEKDTRHRGEYKTLPNHVEAFDRDGTSLGIVFQTVSPFDTPQRMEELIAWYEKEVERAELHPLLCVAVFVVVFLEIHPFQDGNGRLSRVLTTLLLLRAGYSYVPYSSLESVIEQNKESYYLSLRRTQSTIRTEHPEWGPWIDYFLQSLVSQTVRLEEKLTREHALTPGLPPLSQEIMALVQARGKLSMADLVATTGRSRGTIKDHVARLVATGHLARHGAGRGVWYERTTGR